MDNNAPQKLSENTDFTVNDIQQLLKTDILLAVKRCMMYEPNTPATWDRAKQAVDFEISRYSAFIEKYDIIIDGTQYNDVIAQQSSSLAEYKLKYMAMYGKEAFDISDIEFNIRHYVTKPSEVYFNVNIVFVGGETVSISMTVS